MLHDKNILFVDPDGTLVSTDTLFESILIFLKANPFLATSPLSRLYRART